MYRYQVLSLSLLMRHISTHVFGACAWYGIIVTTWVFTSRTCNNQPFSDIKYHQLCHCIITFTVYIFYYSWVIILLVAMLWDYISHKNLSKYSFAFHLRTFIWYFISIHPQSYLKTCNNKDIILNGMQVASQCSYVWVSISFVQKCEMKLQISF